MKENDQGKRALKHVEDKSPFHLFELDVVGPHSTWKNKMFGFIKEERILNNPSVVSLEKIFKSHEIYHIWMHPKNVTSDKHENSEEKNIDKITQWELVFEIRNVEKEAEYAGYSFYNETEKQIEIDLGVGNLEEIEEILYKISLKLPEKN